MRAMVTASISRGMGFFPFLFLTCLWLPECNTPVHLLSAGISVILSEPHPMTGTGWHYHSSVHWRGDEPKIIPHNDFVIHIQCMRPIDPVKYHPQPIIPHGGMIIFNQQQLHQPDENTSHTHAIGGAPLQPWLGHCCFATLQCLELSMFVFPNEQEYQKRNGQYHNAHRITPCSWVQSWSSVRFLLLAVSGAEGSQF